jgi:FkbM family methyltransferase
MQRVRLGQRYLRLFDSFRDRVRYYRCRHGRANAAPIALRVRGVPEPLWCRPHSSDAATLWGTFGEAFHLPEHALPRRPVILDLGANVGYTMVDYARRYPEARVIGVEMDAANAALAVRNVAPWGDRCTVVHAAVWVCDGWVEYEGEEAWGYRVSQHVGAARPPAGGPRPTAPGRRVSALLQDAGVERVDFMKVDIERAETEVLADGEDWLAQVGALTLEVHAFAALARCRSVLEGSGFTVRPHARHPRGLLARRDGP